jgi:hypothetical protein
MRFFFFLCQVRWHWAVTHVSCSWVLLFSSRRMYLCARANSIVMGWSRPLTWIYWSCYCLYIYIYSVIINLIKLQKTAWLLLYSGLFFSLLFFSCERGLRWKNRTFLTSSRTNSQLDLTAALFWRKLSLGLYIEQKNALDVDTDMIDHNTNIKPDAKHITAHKPTEK